MDGDAPRVIGYCTNVHAGATLDETRENLGRHAVAVREALGLDDALGIGLWLSAAAARELAHAGEAARFAGWLRDARLDVFTINGFPFGDFHRRVVKHDVYRPDWRTPERLAYTLDLARLLAAIRPGDQGSISTLPLGWGPWFETDDDVAEAAAMLRRAAHELAELEQRTGTLVHLDLEPEPGCVLQRAADVARLFERHLLGDADDAVIRRHLRVCHDVCHAAVMFEDQAAMLAAYDAVGVRVGKVQVSSAVRAVFDAGVDATRRALQRFREDRYLHQTTVRSDGRDEPVFFEDLAAALASGVQGREWRVHFHVPVFLERLGPLHTTAGEIDTWLGLVRRRPEIRHFEVETYAWDVLPAEHKGTLAEDIAAELRWLDARMAAGQGA